jgi:hypothetical protein
MLDGTPCVMRQSHNSMRPFVVAKLLLTASAVGTCIVAAANTGHLSIDAIRVMPYYVGDGVVRTTTDLLDKRLALRNIIIPTGPTGDPLHRSRIEDWDIVFGTTAIVVDVTVAGADIDRKAAQTRILFRATTKTSGRTLASQDVALSSLTVPGLQRIHVPFLVYGTGCEPLEVKVKVVQTDESASEVVRTIPFSCGE